jgi:hypothetical protein
MRIIHAVLTSAVKTWISGGEGVDVMEPGSESGDLVRA